MKSRAYSYLQLSPGFIITHHSFKCRNDQIMMVNVLVTEMEGSSVRSYLPITALCGFEMTNSVDKTRGLQTFRMDATNMHHLPHGELSAVVFIIIAPIFDSWLVRKHELSFFPFTNFRWLLAFCFDPLTAENEDFRWLMSTLEARLNHRNLIFCLFLDRTKINISFELVFKIQDSLTYLQKFRN
jgi:hypothetical protein